MMTANYSLAHESDSEGLHYNFCLIFFILLFYESFLHNFSTVLQMDQLQVQHHIFVSFFQVALVSVEYDNLQILKKSSVVGRALQTRFIAVIRPFSCCISE